MLYETDIGRTDFGLNINLELELFVIIGGHNHKTVTDLKEWILINHQSLMCE